LGTKNILPGYKISYFGKKYLTRAQNFLLGTKNILPGYKYHTQVQKLLCETDLLVGQFFPIPPKLMLASSIRDCDVTQCIIISKTFFFFSLFKILRVATEQGDTIGRIFAFWVFLFFKLLFETY
jgi:hypothetical protein